MGSLLNNILGGAVQTLQQTITQPPVDLSVPLNHVGRKMDGIYELEDTNVIDLINVTKKFKTDKGYFTLFDNLNFSIPDFKGHGQFISIMGQSGSGKSQLLNLISGLSNPTTGSVNVFGEPLKPKHSIPMVFQQYSSFNWLNVIDNVSLPLQLKGVGKKERYEKAMEIIKIVGLEGKEYQWTNSLSGGQQQRVAIARGLIASSQIILFDEISSGLDIATKNEIQDLILNIFYGSNLDPTFINVTHDINMAVYLSNRIYIMKRNPCEVVKTIDIDFKCVRDKNILDLPSYREHVKEIEMFMNNFNR